VITQLQYKERDVLFQQDVSHCMSTLRWNVVLAKGFYLVVTAFIIYDPLLSSFCGTVLRSTLVSPLPVTSKNLEDSTRCIVKIDNHVIKRWIEYLCGVFRDTCGAH
jgi:hypothetical protein